MLPWTVVTSLLAAAAAMPEPAPGGPSVEVVWSAAVPVRDGAKLNARLFLPAGRKRGPALVALSPYTTDRLHGWAMYFAQHGFPVVLADTRGRGDSPGKFVPFVPDGRDGHDLVEWAARQPWCSGKVGMFGGSYVGFTQWATAAQAPPHLASIAPTAAVFPGLDFPTLRGIVAPYVAQWLSYVSGRALNPNAFDESQYWRQVMLTLWRDGRPLADLARLTGIDSPLLADMLARPPGDPAWKTLVPSDVEYARITIPVLTITGFWDDDQTGALEYYRRHVAAVSADACSRHFLVLGPWDHFGTRYPKSEHGGITVAPAGVLDMKDLHLRWFDWTLRGGPRPEFLAKRVVYYVTGAEIWRRADRLEEVGRTDLMFHLVAGPSAARDVFASGALASTPAESAPAAWTHDSLGSSALGSESPTGDSDPAWLRSQSTGNWIVDQRLALQVRGTGAVYHSAPLDEPVELAGRPALRAFVELDVADEDLYADLYEVADDGTSVLLSRSVLRARHRAGLDHDVPARVGTPEPYEFTFDWIARKLSKGSRVRLVVGSLDHFTWQRNLHVSKPVAEQKRADAKVAHVKLHGSPAMPSTLRLPLNRATAPTASR